MQGKQELVALHHQIASLYLPLDMIAYSWYLFFTIEIYHSSREHLKAATQIIQSDESSVDDVLKGEVYHQMAIVSLRIDPRKSVQLMETSLNYLNTTKVKLDFTPCI